MSHLPLKSARSAIASTLANTRTRICEMIVKTIVFSSATQNVWLSITRWKFSRPVKLILVLPTVALETL